jgi:bifunctional UDP-N-acetylglucosamine pyrophosphorylase / glucosamine-1-phosphate N-acetyltransferase
MKTMRVVTAFICSLIFFQSCVAEPANINNVRAVVLAAGRSTRFKTKKSKQLYPICGAAMVLYPLRALESLGIPVSLVLGYQRDEIRREVEQVAVKDVTFVVQEEQKGTGHAVACTQQTWDKEHLLILNGDTPLMSKEILVQMINEHCAKDAAITFLTTTVADPKGYGRVITENGTLRIVEEKDCTPEQRKVSTVNAGFYIMKTSFVRDFVNCITKSSVTGEIYITELVKMACDAKLPVHTVSVPYDAVRGVNTLNELRDVDMIKRTELMKYWMARGVRFELSEDMHIDLGAEIGSGSVIGAGVHLIGKTKIGENCIVGPYSIIEDTFIGDEAEIGAYSFVQQCTIVGGIHIAPFTQVYKEVIQ